MPLMHPERKGWSYHTRSEYTKGRATVVRCINPNCKHIFNLKDRHFCPKCGTFVS